MLLATRFLRRKPIGVTARRTGFLGGLSQLRFSTVDASDVNLGDFIEWSGKKMQLVGRENKTTGRRAYAVVVAELQEVASGKRHQERWRPEEKIEVLDIFSRHVDFVSIDEDGENYIFKEEDDEEVEVPINYFGDKAPWFKEGIQVVLRYVEETEEFLNWTFITHTATYVIKETRPSLPSHDNPRSKPAILENGKKIKIPPTLEEGEAIVVDLRTEAYHSRAE